MLGHYRRRGKICGVCYVEFYWRCGFVLPDQGHAPGINYLYQEFYATSDYTTLWFTTSTMIHIGIIEELELMERTVAVERWPPAPLEGRK
mmetsp:Transcript_38651/g.52404  ORF Transcript_38651/g.52404 Transcript_38651/m.52404 type:complete len:90 (+) Transcript_38651:739-1008(+)